MDQTGLKAVPVVTRHPERFRGLIGEDAYAEVAAAMEHASKLLSGRVVWHVNSTARGGGVAELLQSLLGYARGAGVDARWMVVDGSPAFFEVTKRIHNRLHGSDGDGGPLGAAEREVYEESLRAAAADLAQMVSPADIVFCHDPQTAGLVVPLLDSGATVVWRCHVGIDLPNDTAREAWAFLREYVRPAHAYVFTRPEYAWEGLPEERVYVIPPSIDVFAPKNQELTARVVDAILDRTGIGPDGGHGPGSFTRSDGTPGRVDRRAQLDQDGPVPADAPLVTQVSRWDRLKDPLGVIQAFAGHCQTPGAHLLLAGPNAGAVSDDPEGAAVLAQVRELRAGLPDAVRSRIHLACLPMDDVEENAAMVNAIQRRSQVIVQKSLAEGFGLTVAEAMWKARPVVASRAGGIQDQIADGVTGVLIDDPHDLARFGAAWDGLLSDPAGAERIGAAAREWVLEKFLGPRHLLRYLALLDELLNVPVAAQAEG
jgi:trehalose synthase